MLVNNQSFRAPSRDTVLKDVLVEAPVGTINDDGVMVIIATGALSQDLWAVESMVGYLTEAKDYLLSQLVSLKAAAGAGQPINVSVARDGSLGTSNSFGLFRFRIGGNVADESQSHTIDAMFKLCVAKLLEESKTGYQYTAPP